MLKNVFEGLNEQQVKAVQKIDGALLVLAGAGSGKTTVITRRICYMIEKGIDPRKILAVTFSNKAAEEMRSRVAQYVPDGMGEKVKIKTIHAICAEILRIEKELLGKAIFHRELNKFSICSSSECVAVTQEALVDTKFDQFDGITAAGMQGRIDRTKNMGITVEGMQKICQQERMYVNEVFLKIYKQYQSILQKNGCMDFNDLIMYVLELFEKFPEVREKYQERYQHIMVDEYQDTNRLQYLFVQSLASKYRNICVVGDDDQSIYGFRGADVRNILSFKDDYPEAEMIYLSRNYRSSRYIVGIANSVISNNVNRIKKQMSSFLPDETELRLGRFSTAEKEAEEVAKSIEASFYQGIPYNEMAVIFRNRYVAKPIERELSKRGIPYKLSQGTRILDHKEPKDIMAFLRLVDNTGDDIAFRRIINVPKTRLSADSMKVLCDFARRERISLFDSLKRSNEIWAAEEVPDTISCFIRMIEFFQKTASEAKIEELINEILDKTGYLDFVQAHTPQYTTEYLFDLLEFAKEFDMKTDRTLNEFLQKAMFVMDSDKHYTAPAVSLLSGHSCKGLEFDLVYIIGLEDGILPDYRAISDSKRFDSMEEERRLFYVMLTRAKKYLVLSSAEVRKQRVDGNVIELQQRQESRFLGELGVFVES